MFEFEHEEQPVMEDGSGEYQRSFAEARRELTPDEMTTQLVESAKSILALRKFVGNISNRALRGLLSDEEQSHPWFRENPTAEDGETIEQDPLNAFDFDVNPHD